MPRSTGSGNIRSAYRVGLPCRSSSLLWIERRFTLRYASFEWCELWLHPRRGPMICHGERRRPPRRAARSLRDDLPEKWQRPGAEVSSASEDGSDVWTFEGSVIPNIGLNAVAGRPKEEYGVEPTAFDEMRPGCYDIDERVKDMDAGGVLGSMCFPSFPGFSGRLFAAARRQGPRARGPAGLQRLARRRVVRVAPRALHPDGTARAVGRRARGRRGPPPRRQGRALADVHREPGDARLPVVPQRPLGPAVARAVRRRRPCCRSTSGRPASSRSPRPTRRST